MEMNSEQRKLAADEHRLYIRTVRPGPHGRELVRCGCGKWGPTTPLATTEVNLAYVTHLNNVLSTSETSK